MKKTVLSLLLLAGLGVAANAQQGATNKISAGLELALPTGDNADVFSFGYGASLQGEFNVAKNLNLTANAGYLSFRLKKEIKELLESFGEDTKGSGAIPLKAGAKYFFAGKFYGQAEVGAAISTDEDGGTAFSYAPGIGLNLPISEKTIVDLGIRYENWRKDGIGSSFFGLRAAVAFGL
ncbi:outer membrane beta-barrel protein [Nubsella zeaxanthinifaciens]|jgi:opacity protein-like surface antigen|uniref:outer membrane beta-barrel protein n=1 Tax=Nubsella zeaxanthinifaciens TaxID=392412 RepID=UPI003D043157